MLTNTTAETSESDKPSVCMLISNEVLSDGRVMREAQALSNNYDLTIIGWLRPERKTRFDWDLANSLPFRLRLAELFSARFLPKNIFGYAIRYLEMLFRFFFSACRIKPEVVHAQEFDSLLIGYLISKYTGAKLIYDAHELYRESGPPGGAVGSSVMPWLESFLMKRCDQIIACNSQRAQIMHEEYGAPFLPRVLRNVPPYSNPPEGTDKLRQFVHSKNPNIQKIIVHPGGLAGRGANVALPALSKLPETFALVLIGYSNQQHHPEIVSLIAKHNLSHRVLFHPQVPYAELADYVCSGDVGLVSYPNINRNNFFCAPNKLYEYAMAGIPVVAVDHPPCREFLEQYPCGKCFVWDDPDDLAKSVLDCLSDENRRQQMREEALRAATDVNWENEREVLLSLYNELLNTQ